MKTPMLDEWEALGSEWRAAPDLPPPNTELVERLRRRVRRRSRQRVATLVAEVLVSITVVWWALGQVPRQGLESWILRLGIFAFTALVWGFGLWSRRHGWRAEGSASSDFLRLSRERLAEGRRSIRFVRVTLGVAAAGFVPWCAARAADGAIADGERWIWIVFAFYLASMLGWCAGYARWIRREDEWLDRMARECDEQTRG